MKEKTQRVVKFGKEGIEKDIILNPNNFLNAASFEEGFETIKHYLDFAKTLENKDEKAGYLRTMEFFIGYSEFVDLKYFEKILNYVGLTLEEFESYASKFPRDKSLKWFWDLKKIE